MKFIKTDIEDVIIVEPDCFGDHRGWFMETYNKAKYVENGITADFVQDNKSFSAQKGTLRGLHWQNHPMAQAKLVSVAKGNVIDVAVDIRKGSPTYLKSVVVELSAENKRQLFIPRGFAHGFVTISDDVEFTYKVDNLYSNECDSGMYYDDAILNINWHEILGDIKPILSDKDQSAPMFEDSDCNFVYEEK